jgi:hypothetical protein
MPPAGELFDRDELLRKLIYDYHVPGREAGQAIRKAESGGDGDLPEWGLVVRREFSAPGPPKFTLRGTGR